MATFSASVEKARERVAIVEDDAMKALVHTGPFRPRSHR
jgi:hypothetical protein